ncbi:MAG: 30S ribosomal protein S8 [Candidatus Heimdallarchaeota archaeon]
MLHDPLADALAAIKNAERVGKKECVVRASKVIKAVLKVMQEKGYIGAFEFIDDGRSGKFKIELKGKVIDCNVIKPRFSMGLDEFEKYEKRFLPARSVGLLILTTPKGIMDHNKARELHLGGKLLAYVY